MIQKKFCIKTFGCQMNVNDAQWLAEMLSLYGFNETGPEDADIFLLYTCSVREKPEIKLKNMIKRIRHESRGSKDRIVGILGCAAQQLGKMLFEFSPQARLVCGPDGLRHVPDALEKLCADPLLKLDFLEFDQIYEEREILPLHLQRGDVFVNIMQGCDNFCSYCIVPFTRGRQKSRKPEAIIEECQRLLQAGAREICLLGQNVNAYGKDFKSHSDKSSFVELLYKIAGLPDCERLRYITPHPADFDDAAIRAFRDLPNLCPRLHLPLQSGSDAILKKMRRRYSVARYLGLVEKLREARPDLAISTDLIVGFPGEGEADFQETLGMMRKCGFMASFSFCYSDRPGTRSERMADKILPEIMKERLVRLQDLQDEMSSVWLQKRIGSLAEICVEGPSPRDPASWLQGKDPYGVMVNVKADKKTKPGSFLKVKITGVKKHSLVAEAAE